MRIANIVVGIASILNLFPDKDFQGRISRELHRAHQRALEEGIDEQSAIDFAYQERCAGQILGVAMALFCWSGVFCGFAWGWHTCWLSLLAGLPGLIYLLAAILVNKHGWD